MESRTVGHGGGCWAEHHECAIAEIYRLLGERARLTDSLTGEDVRALIDSASLARGGRPLSAAEARALVGWGNEIRRLAATLEAVLKGYISIDLVDGKPELLANARTKDIIKDVASGRLRVGPPRP